MSTKFHISISITVCLLLFSFYKTNAQNVSHNYILSRIYTNEHAATWLDNIVYTDGLGRVNLEVSVGITPQGENLARLKEYDTMGRIHKEWLPVPTIDSYTPPMSLKTTANDFYSDICPYSNVTYEPWYKSRVILRNGAGSAWGGHDVAMTYTTNSIQGQTACKRYAVDVVSGMLMEQGMYDVGQLLVTQTTDEDDRIALIFTDKQDKQLLTRKLNGSSIADTYYVYDRLDNLCYVLTPAYQNEPDVDLNAYKYRYDDSHRCISKKMPGREEITYTYDEAGRVTSSTDGNQRLSDKTCLYQYDGLDRLTEQIEVTCGVTATDTILLQRNYYDDYSFIGTDAFDISLFPAENKNSNGLLTGRKISILGTNNYIYEAIYYDGKGRACRTLRRDHLNGVSNIQTSYTFTGLPDTITTTYTTTDHNIVTTCLINAYDHAGRLLTTTCRINNGEDVTLVENAYDDLGRLHTSTKGNNQTLRTEYGYNIRGWLTSMSNPLFSERLYYNESHNGSTPQYGGNISALDWQVCLPSGQNRMRGYSFAYDRLSRLTAANYTEDDTYNGHYDTEYSYDIMGNPVSVRRKGLQDNGQYELIDDLVYEYNGNQLVRATDDIDGPFYAGAMHFRDGADEDEEYAYDENGNMTQDLNSGIENIEYNILNLPKLITFANGGTIRYTYSATGEKLRAEYAMTSDSIRKN